MINSFLGISKKNFLTFDISNIFSTFYIIKNWTRRDFLTCLFIFSLLAAYLFSFSKREKAG